MLSCENQVYVVHVNNVGGFCPTVTDVFKAFKQTAWGGQSCFNLNGNDFSCSALNGCPSVGAIEGWSSVCDKPLFQITGNYTSASLTVSSNGGNSSSSILYGFMFEDINHSGDGGIHAQLLRSNGFQGNAPSLVGYAAAGGAAIARDAKAPLNAAITSSLRVDVGSSTGQVGFINEGYNGVPVNADTYKTSFYIRGTYTGPVTIELVGNSTGTVYGGATVNVESVADSFKQFSTTFESTQSSEDVNVWRLTFDASLAANSSLWFALPQLFPSTYKGRENGLRKDIAEFLSEINPRGRTPSLRWKWNETIGPVELRPGRQGDWTYGNSDALGLMEYLQWAEDMNMTPVLGVWSGFSLDETTITGAALAPYIQDTLNELEFLLGDISTPYGKLRADLGHPEPYTVRHIEIGNEDGVFTTSCASYPERFMAYHNAISEAYPSLQIIASTGDKNCLPNPLPNNVWVDIHHYLSPIGFLQLFDEFDNFPRANGSGVFIGEYACTQVDGSNVDKSTMQGAVGEAAYMIGIERNSDVIKMAAYAPLLEHFGMAQWKPNLVGFDSRAGSLTGSVSYYVQKMFANARGDTVLPVKSDVILGPLYWVATSSVSSYQVKLANYGEKAQNITLTLPDEGHLESAAKLETISGPPAQVNLPFNVTLTPVASVVESVGQNVWNFIVPAYGVAVLVVNRGIQLEA
ncbi:glycoside hydrolase family 51 protein [Cladochytrium replicatum]|nr:glycoside hydrolase family 51 protein [Cladochytrium replicatum]